MKKHFKLILVFLIIIFIFLLIFYINKLICFNRIDLVSSDGSKSNLEINDNLNQANFYSNNILINKLNDNIIAYLSIPKINLFNVPIEHGTNENVLSKAIGLFENSNIDGGNVCLAAHNRSKTVSYFRNLWKLSTGDEIILKTKANFSIYTVMFVTEILSNDWTYLQNEKEDYITCITCIDNKPNKRLCIRGVKK